MKTISYKEKAEEFLKKAEAEVSHEYCLPNVAADYYKKAALFFVMDKNFEMAAKQYASAANYALEDGEVKTSIEYLIEAGNNCPDERHVHAVPYYELASKYAEDAQLYSFAASCQKGIAEIWENADNDVSAAEHYRMASLFYQRAEMSFATKKMEEKFLSLMSKIANQNKVFIQ